MAKHRINKMHKAEIKHIINNYLTKKYEEDERYKKIQKSIKYFENLCEEEQKRLTGITDETIEVLKKFNIWCSKDVAKLMNFSRGTFEIDVRTVDTWHDVSEELYKSPYAGEYPYRCCSMTILLYRYLDSLEEFNEFKKEVDEFYSDYSKALTAFYNYIDSSRTLEEVKNYITIKAVGDYIDQAMYQCSTNVLVLNDDDKKLMEKFMK